MITVKFLREFGKFRDLEFLPDNSAFTAAVRAELAAGGYDDAAKVETDNPEIAYRALQNGALTDSWTLDPPRDVHPLLPAIKHDGRLYGQRSASVGDVFVVVGGPAFLCCSVGFVQILPVPEDSRILI